MSVKEEKNLLRKQCAAIRNGISQDEKAQRDEKICSLCASLAIYRFADTVLLYHPIRSEVDVRPLIDSALADGKEVYLPLCDKTEPGKMQFHRIMFQNDLSAGSFGVMEPSLHLPVWMPDDGKRAVCLIPALAYGKDGFRLGYGKGYYDRFLQGFNGTGIGITYSELILPTVPHNRFDLKADLLVSEKGVSITREV